MSYDTCLCPVLLQLGVRALPRVAFVAQEGTKIDHYDYFSCG